MLPCYGVVRASWVGLVTTLTAYVEGGGGEGGSVATRRQHSHTAQTVARE